MYSTVYEKREFMGARRENDYSDHRSYPFASVNIAVIVDSWLGALPAASPEVDTLNHSAFKGRAGGDQLRVGRECSLQALQEGQVVCVRMVCTKPRKRRQGSGLSTGVYFS
jgi:hypothetical protein